MAAMQWRSSATQRAWRKTSSCCRCVKLSLPSSYTMETCITSGKNGFNTSLEHRTMIMIHFCHSPSVYDTSWSWCQGAQIADIGIARKRVCLIKIELIYFARHALPPAGTWCSSGAGCISGPIPPDMAFWPSACS